MENIVQLAVIDYLIIFAYIGAMLYVGYYFSKKKKGFDDYFMAGRNLTAPLLVGTLVSTFYGLDALFGTSEIAFMEGISAFFSFSIPYQLLYVTMAFISPKIKQAFPSGTTMQEITFKKYGKKAGIFSSIAAYLYSTNTVEMMGIGFILRITFGMPFWMGTLIGCVVVVIYTYSGGLWAVTMTDFVQFVAMLVTVGIATLVGWHAIGGHEQIWAGLIQWAGSAEDAACFFQVGAGYLTPWTLVSYSLTAFVVLCEPAFFQRIFASSSAKEIKKAFVIGIPMWVSFDFCVTLLGILAAAAIGLGIMPEVAPNEALFAVVAQYLPVGLMGLFFAGVLACSMSTADSYFLVAGGVIGYDIYKGAINPNASQEQCERYTRYGMLLSAAISLGLSLVFDRIMGVWVFQATILVATSLIPVYFGALSKKAPKKIAGTAATFTGLLGSIIFYASTIIFGYEDEEIGTFILKIGNFEIWQEYGIIIITPIVLVVYLIFNALGKETAEDDQNKDQRKITV